MSCPALSISSTVCAPLRARRVAKIESIRSRDCFVKTRSAIGLTQPTCQSNPRRKDKRTTDRTETRSSSPPILSPERCKRRCRISGLDLSRFWSLFSLSPGEEAGFRSRKRHMAGARVSTTGSSNFCGVPPPTISCGQSRVGAHSPSAESPNSLESFRL
jgi:hypothetical protein